MPYGAGNRRGAKLCLGEDGDDRELSLAAARADSARGVPGGDEEGFSMPLGCVTDCP